MIPAFHVALDIEKLFTHLYSSFIKDRKTPGLTSAVFVAEVRKPPDVSPDRWRSRPLRGRSPASLTRFPAPGLLASVEPPGVYEDCDQGRSQGGGEGVRPPWGFRAPAGRRPARAKTPAEATETLTEITKSVRKPTKKHVRAVGAPLTIWARQKNKAPVTFRGSRTAGYIISESWLHHGPLQACGPLKFRHFIFHFIFFVYFGPLPEKWPNPRTF